MLCASAKTKKRGKSTFLESRRGKGGWKSKLKKNENFNYTLSLEVGHFLRPYASRWPRRPSAPKNGGPPRMLGPLTTSSTWVMPSSSLHLKVISLDSPRPYFWNTNPSSPLSSESTPWAKRLPLEQLLRLELPRGLCLSLKADIKNKKKKTERN